MRDGHPGRHHRDETGQRHEAEDEFHTRIRYVAHDGTALVRIDRIDTLCVVHTAQDGLSLNGMLTQPELQADLERFGIAAGDLVMVHASLRKVGPIVGGAATLIATLDSLVGSGAVLMNVGPRDDVPFDPLLTPTDPDNGVLAELFRTTPGTIVTDNPQGRFAARGPRAAEVLRDAPWNDYYGPGSPLEHLYELNGKVLRLGADPGTVTLLHYAEYLVPLAGKRRVRRDCFVATPDGPRVRSVECLDDADGIVDYPGEDYFADILIAYLATGRARQGRVGNAQSELLDARDYVDFGVQWMINNLQ
jgi:aminoglycoside 3-N-acetyltransferase